MKKITQLGGIGALALTAAISLAAPDLYRPTSSIKDQGITLKGWGSGTASETPELAFEGTSSIRISSRNYFQGGIFNYAKPVDVKSSAANPNNMILLTFQVPGTSTQLGGGGDPEGRGGGPAGLGGPGGPPGGLAGGGGRGQAGGGISGPGGAAGPQGGQAGAAKAPAVSSLRIVISTTDGKKSETYLDIATVGASRGNWRSSGVPLQAITGFSKTNMQIKSIAISADSTGSIYIGEMRILEDSTPIYGEINSGDLNLALGDNIILSGSGNGGATPLKYSWDFDAADGIAVDAEGQSVTRKFRKPGTYTITLTISDRYGLKKPFQRTMKVVVNP